MNKSIFLFITLLVAALTVRYVMRKRSECQEFEFSKEERLKLVENLKKTHFSGEYTLPESKVKLSVGKEFTFAGAELSRSFGIFDEYYNDDLEATLFDSIAKSTISFSNLDMGYIPLDTYRDVSPNELRYIIEGAVDLRSQEDSSVGAGRVADWVKKPVLFREKDLIFFSIEIEYENKGFEVYQIAIKFGRKGCEVITLTQDKDVYEKFGNRFNKILDVFNFGPGLGYKNYQEGDKIAKYNIPGLLCFILDSSYRQSEKNREKLELVQKQIASGEFDVNGYAKEEVTHLLFACMENNFEMVKVLVKNGAEKTVDESTSDGLTPLSCACYNQNLLMVEFLLEHGARASIDKEDDRGITPLLLVVALENSSLVRVLMQNGAGINVANKDGVTPLINACVINSLAMVKLLIEYGAREGINTLSCEGTTPLLYACMNNNIEMAEFLIKCGAQKSIRVTDKNGNTTFAYAKNNKELSKILKENMQC